MIKPPPRSPSDRDVPPTQGETRSVEAAPAAARVVGVTRRALLGGAVLAYLDACRRRAVGDRGGGARFEGLPIDQIEGFLTPNELFFVRNHFGIPQPPKSGPWRFSIEGEVEQPLPLDVGALGEIAPVDRPVTLECAGNAGRNGLGRPGGPRAFSGVSTAAFQGVPLAPLLRRARLRASVVEVVFEGADSGQEAGATEPSAFARSVPLAAALDGSVFLATGMNGAPLPAPHGGPLRVVFPGRYATDSVKWVKRIIAVSSPFEGFYQRSRYRHATSSDPDGISLGTLKVQSEISRPRPGERLPPELPLEISGLAWGGLGGPAGVRVSVDGGATFTDATFLDPERPACWRRWSLRWRPEGRGPRLILSQAFDHAGSAQPFASDEELGLGYSISGSDRIQYANNAVPVIPITIG